MAGWRKVVPQLVNTVAAMIPLLACFLCGGAGRPCWICPPFSEVIIMKLLVKLPGSSFSRLPLTAVPSYSP
ncbi:hypothetical protein BO94DRAFT_7430 [Aspergillus sclerotioniger CBS 115572]|uniref:Uncharacterized protein n=1 Tax=Aspergillus sclerotioniger CBS 115572 TaxID=1450535 RepID=A0A317XCW4_9EURO|nr:hypothetical protein BO94DRAFT_7430 [Aspergillus sclerotioniger CBS 115572]PWY96359.1 hypothetical protein BO94DRAFT_7430 [Aspergillus sclerotioniger CBS 115572]